MHDATKYQQRLADLSYLARDQVDGVFGPISLAAYNRYRATRGLPPVNTTSIAELEAVLFPKPQPVWKGPNIVQATIIDYLLNMATSKINWAAAALVAVVVGWLNTKYGFNVPQDVQNYVTGLLVAGGGALIVILRTFFNKPKVIQGGTKTTN